MAGTALHQISHQPVPGDEGARAQEREKVRGKNIKERKMKGQGRKRKKDEGARIQKKRNTKRYKIKTNW